MIVLDDIPRVKSYHMTLITICVMLEDDIFVCYCNNSGIVVYCKSGGYYTRKNIFAGFTKNPCNEKFVRIFLCGRGGMSK